MENAKNVGKNQITQDANKLDQASIELKNFKRLFDP